MFDKKTGHLKLDKSLWTPVFAFTISPRDSYDKSGLEKAVNDFWKEVGNVYGVHLAPHTWGSYAPKDLSKTELSHLHGTMFQLVSEVDEGKKITLSGIRACAKMKSGRLFKSDNLNETFKSITDLDGWHGYTNGGHHPIASLVYCPQVRKGCKPKKNRKGILACSIKRKMWID
tara:strand:- start:1580 stop:2098 length:519 start_codon:yes stop_codon:yes gene_type:complete